MVQPCDSENRVIAKPFCSLLMRPELRQSLNVIMKGVWVYIYILSFQVHLEKIAFKKHLGHQLISSWGQRLQTDKRFPRFHVATTRNASQMCVAVHGHPHKISELQSWAVCLLLTCCQTILRVCYIPAMSIDNIIPQKTRCWNGSGRAFPQMAFYQLRYYTSKKFIRNNCWYQIKCWCNKGTPGLTMYPILQGPARSPAAAGPIQRFDQPKNWFPGLRWGTNRF